ncbi:hypothetical protein [Pectobacterium brasiliense]|nr:hypothetical protein [Pectobacterium brasiliense]MBN3121896.1 hypothetical protein [Pectobacterium brasiliense]
MPSIPLQWVGNSPSGSQSFDGLDVTTLSYNIGYGVGPLNTSAYGVKIQ